MICKFCEKEISKSETVYVDKTGSYHWLCHHVVEIIKTYPEKVKNL